jgi:hypothetical protein
MATKFRIGVNTAEEILSNPPPEFRHLNVLFAPIAVRVGNMDFPASFWTDFAGVVLFKWYWVVWKLAEAKSRFARLPFWYTYEMWLRRTTKQWWRLSLVERKTETREITHEVLLIPEIVESALLTAIQKVVAGARRVGVWTEDCAALDSLLNDREEYLEGLEAGTIRPPTFLTDKFAVPFPVNTKRPQLVSEPLWGDCRLPPSSRELSQPLQHRINAPPILCPRCAAVLQPWGERMQQQTCPLCGERIPR